MSRSASRNGASSADPRLYPAPTTPTSAAAPPPPALVIPSNYPQPGHANRPSPAPITPSTAAPSHPPRPSSAPAPSTQAEALPPGFEVLIQLEASVFERINPDAAPPQHFHGVPALPPPQPSATLLVIQGPLAPDPHSTEMLYYAFINTREYNFPLMPSTTCRRIGPKAFRIKVDHRRFVITLAPSTNPKMVEGFIALLQWFCTWKDVEGSHTPGRMDESPSAASNGSSSIKGGGTIIEKAGEKSIQQIERVVARLNSGTQSFLDKHTSAAVQARERGETKNLRLGGKVTVGALNATQKVLSTTARVTGDATDKVAATIGRGISKTVAKPLANAPEGSKRRKLYSQLASGCLAAGRIWVSLDTHGRTLIVNTRDSAALWADAKYGPEAEHAFRQLGHIALDGYRVWKFPSDLGFKAMLFTGLEEEVRRVGKTPPPPPPPTYADEPAQDSLVNPSQKNSTQPMPSKAPKSSSPSFTSTSSSSSIPSTVRAPRAHPQPSFAQASTAPSQSALVQGPPAAPPVFPDSGEPVMHIPFQDLSVNLPKK